MCACVRIAHSSKRLSPEASINVRLTISSKSLSTKACNNVLLFESKYQTTCCHLQCLTSLRSQSEAKGYHVKYCTVSSSGLSPEACDICTHIRIAISSSRLSPEAYNYIKLKAITKSLQQCAPVRIAISSSRISAKASNCHKPKAITTTL